jgi:hypothetical protein
MSAPPSFRKVNPADSPIFYLALSSSTLPLSTVDEYAQTLLAQRISTTSGVAQVQVLGSQKYAVRVQLDPKALASRGIGIDEVAEAISRQNSNLPTGTLFGQHRAYTVETNGQLANAASFRPVVVTIATAHRCVWVNSAGWWTGRERQARRLVQRPAQHPVGDPAPARHQYHRGGQFDQEAAAHLPVAGAARHQYRDPVRPLPVHP